MQDPTPQQVTPTHPYPNARSKLVAIFPTLAPNVQAFVELRLTHLLEEVAMRGAEDIR